LRHKLVFSHKHCWISHQHVRWIVDDRFYIRPFVL
jgi:hypothetical protein